MRSFLIFAAVTSAQAFGASALFAAESTIDLRKAGRSLAGLENVSQGYEKTNLCGFFTFSQYLDGWRIQNRAERGESMERSSAIAIGVDHAIQRNIPYWFPIQNSTDPLNLQLGRWGSTFCALAQAVKEEGYCVDSSLPTKTADSTAKFSDVTTFIYGKLLRIAETPFYAQRAMIERQLPQIYERYSNWGGDRVASLEQVREWMLLQTAKPYQIIRSMFFPTCASTSSRKFDFDFGSCRSEMYAGLDVTGVPIPNEDPLRTDRAARRVHELLSRPNPMPVPFSYCSTVLLQGKKYDGASPIGRGCRIHWSLIVGRKSIGDEGYLLVRNTWKPGTKYSPDWVVEGGDIWVREKELFRSMLLVQWLE